MSFYGNYKQLEKIIDNFSNKKIAILGDLMIDRFIRGKVRRISPEAPVPVIEVSNETSTFGGAGNVANNILSLGAIPCIISVIGDDYNGRELLDMFYYRKIKTDYIISHKNQKTIEKTRIIAEHQQVARVDKEIKFKYEKDIREKILENLKLSIKEGCKALILSDYGKGILVPDIIDESISICRKNKIPVFVDPKIEHFKMYKKATSMTPNLMEAFSGMRMIEKSEQEEVIKLGEDIIRELELESLIITQGENGMTVFEKEHGKIKNTHIPSKAKEVFDVTGAGDTVISCLTLSYISYRSILTSAIIANYAAGIVVGKLGTAVTTQEELKKEIKLWLKQ